MGVKNLVIASHVDDEVLGCGGILDETFFVYFCGIDESKIKKNKEATPTGERFIELKKVADFLGFKWECNEKSKVNHYTEQEFIDIFEDLINSIKPRKVFLPHPGYNQDHRTVFNAAFIALRPHDKNFFVKKVLVYEAAHDVIWNPKNMNLNYFVPIDIERKDQTRLVKVEANTFGRSLGTISSELENKISKILLSGDISIQYGGSIKEQKEAFADLVLAFILGLLLTYMVMAAQFESFRDPFIIMFSVPFGVVGVIWSLLLTGQTLNISSFIGLIMLVGIVVNNAIVFLDYTIQQKNQGAKIYNALIESGRVRLRPILMTSVTTIFGMLPLALSRGKGSESWTPLAVTVIGGLIVSMFITLVLIPVVYSLFEDKKPV